MVGSKEGIESSKPELEAHFRVEGRVTSIVDFFLRRPRLLVPKKPYLRVHGMNQMHRDVRLLWEMRPERAFAKYPIGFTGETGDLTFNSNVFVGCKVTQSEFIVQRAEVPPSLRRRGFMTWLALQSWLYMAPELPAFSQGSFTASGKAWADSMEKWGWGII